MASYRDAVEELIAAGAPFAEVEETIDDLAGMTADQRAALWLYAFSLRDPWRQLRDARTQPASLQ